MSNSGDARSSITILVLGDGKPTTVRYNFICSVNVHLVCFCRELSLSHTPHPPSFSSHLIFLLHEHHVNLILISDVELYETFAEGVGKSSLISTFVSRHFSEMVPGLMTQVRLPPEPDSSCITTIRDSQRGDELLQNKSESSLTSLLHKAAQDRVDSIVLVYDLDRVETFYRLETHWLPLIERYYHGEVSTFDRSNERSTLFRTRIDVLLNSGTHNILDLLIKSTLRLSNNSGSGYCSRYKVGFGARNPRRTI